MTSTISGASIQYPTLENLKRALDPTILTAAVSVAFIASAETLLSASAVDQLHQGPRTKYDKELASQGRRQRHLRHCSACCR